MYTVRHARANFKKLLDDAKYHPVAITRNGKTYLLVCKDSAYMTKKKVMPEDVYTKPQEGANPRSVPINEPTSYYSLGSSRTKHTILDEVKTAEASRDEELEFCQDADSAREVTRKYKQRIDALWTEYRELA